jgi:hypothetical protein
MVRASRMYGDNEKCAKFWWESMKGKDHSEDLGVGGRIILKFILWK